MNLRRTVATGLAVLLSATTLVACSSDSSSSSSGDVTIRIGTTDSTKKAWSAMEDAANENGINLEITNFSDYSTPNLALSEDQIDVNQFQHLKFLAEYNTGNNDDLTPVDSFQVLRTELQACGVHDGGTEQENHDSS